MKTAAVIVGGVVALVLIVVGGYFLLWHTADARGSLSAREKTVANGDYRITTYDHFFDLCSSVKSAEGRLKALQHELATTNPDAGRVSQINASISAIEANRYETINQYNADATKNGTRGQFRDSDLPYQLDPNDEETQCAI